MTGRKCVLNLMKNHSKNIGFINVIVTEGGKFDYDSQSIYPEALPGEVFSENFMFSPTVVTGLNRPRKNWLSFAKNQLLNIEQGADCPDEVFAGWVCEAVDSMPLALVIKEKDVN